MDVRNDWEFTLSTAHLQRILYYRKETLDHTTAHKAHKGTLESFKIFFQFLRCQSLIHIVSHMKRNVKHLQGMTSVEQHYHITSQIYKLLLEDRHEYHVRYLSQQ